MEFNQMSPEEKIVYGMELYEAGEMDAGQANDFIRFMDYYGVAHNLNDSGCASSVATEL